jgi:bacteriocin-like protein
MQTSSVTLPSTEFRELDDAELALVSGGVRDIFDYLLDGAAGGAAAGAALGGRTGAAIGGVIGAVGGIIGWLFK